MMCSGTAPRIARSPDFGWQVWQQSASRFITVFSTDHRVVDAGLIGCGMVL